MDTTKDIKEEREALDENFTMEMKEKATILLVQFMIAICEKDIPKIRQARLLITRDAILTSKLFGDFQKELYHIDIKNILFLEECIERIWESPS